MVERPTIRQSVNSTAPNPEFFQPRYGPMRSFLMEVDPKVVHKPHQDRENVEERAMGDTGDNDPFVEYFSGGRVPHTEIEKLAIRARHPEGKAIPKIPKTDRKHRIWANSQRVLF